MTYLCRLTRQASFSTLNQQPSWRFDMKTVLAFLLLALCLLTACGGPARAPATSTAEKPLFTDADIDKAQLITVSELKELIGIEGGLAPAGQELPVLLDSTPELSAQSTLPDTSGRVYYVRHNPRAVHEPPYSIIQHNILTGTSELLYSGEREVQSVAGNQGVDVSGEDGGGWFYMSMRETTDPASDFDIYGFLDNSVVYLLTDDTVDNTNVSFTFNTRERLMVYEEPVAGKASVVLRRWQEGGYNNKVVLSPSRPTATTQHESGW
jgi:hypothetical protein